MTTTAFASRLPWLLLLLVAGAHAEMLCEDVPVEFCAFSVSTAGKRCVLEDYLDGEGRKEYQCRTSEVAVEIASGHIESEECVRACGVDRKMAGISSDGLLEPEFMARLCSPACYGNCPYIVDLYFNLAAGEGGHLPDLCEKQRQDPHRAMVELTSSGAAPGPASPDFSEIAAAPGPSIAPAPRRSLFGFLF